MRPLLRGLLAGLVILVSGCSHHADGPPAVGDVPLFSSAEVRDSQYAVAVTRGRILYIVVAGRDGEDGPALQQRERRLLVSRGWKFNTPGHELPMSRQTAEAYSPDNELFLTMTGKQCNQNGAPQPLARHASRAIADGDPILCLTLAH